MASAEARKEKKRNFSFIEPTLIQQLQSILDQYPDDGQILKELIQNAEDARASKVCFLYDETQHGTDPNTLAHPDIALHQGPALYAYNNAVFDDNDWEGIRMLQDSVKKQDSLKVGRFGLGFKSVFHLTDLPSVLSGDSLALIDPHKKYFMHDGNRTTGIGYPISSFCSENKSCSGHFQPFQGIFGCDQDTITSGHYKGTLFRFPLRKQKSHLSDTLYTPQKISDLFASFERDAHLILLFLKHVESVELCSRKEGGPVETLFKVQLQDACKDNVRASRRKFMIKFVSNSSLDKPAKVVYRMQEETLKYVNGEIIQRNIYPLVISEYFPSESMMSEDLQMLCSDKAIRSLPLVGVAFQLDNTLTWTQEGTSAETDVPMSSEISLNSKLLRVDDGLECDPEGQVFCILPLPVQEKSSSGLPVHVNGFFSISQNRRHLKWPSVGQDIHSDKEILWNQCLLNELIPKAYVNMVLKLVHICKKGDHSIDARHVMSLLPNKAQVDVRVRWQGILEPFYTQVLKCKIFHSPAEGGSWVTIKECVLDCLDEPAGIHSVITKVLLSAGIKVVKLPKHVMLALHEYGAEPLEKISPKLVRTCLKNHPCAYVNLTKDDKLRLLVYILMDDNFSELDGIDLLPLADNSFISFSAASESDPVYIPNPDNPGKLLPRLEHMIIANDLPNVVLAKIDKLAAEGCLQIKHLNKDILCELLPRTFPDSWQQNKPNIFEGEEAPDLLWLKSLWEYLRVQMPLLENLKKLSGLPILVLKKEERSYEIMPLAQPSLVMLDGANKIRLLPEVRTSLEALGIRVVSNVAPYVLAHDAILGNYIRLPLPEDAIDCIRTVIEQGGLNVVDEMKMKTTGIQKSALSEFLGKADIKNLDTEHIGILSSLPLFETVAYGDDRATDFVSIHELKLAAPSSLPDIKINAQLLDMRKDVSRNLALECGAKMLSQAEFLTHVVIPELLQNLDSDQLEQTLDFVMSNLHKLQQEKSDFVENFQKLPFLTSMNGNHQTVMDVFDPEVELLKEIFYHEDKFPLGLFAEPSFLIFLRKLGLKKIEDITAEDVLNSVRKIESLKDCQTAEYNRLKKKSEGLVRHLCQNTNLLNSNVQGQTLRQWLIGISWMTCLINQPDDFPSELLLCQSQTFVSPRSLLPLDAVQLAGCIVHICDNSDAGLLLEALGLALQPTVKQVMLQMKLIKEAYQPRDKAKYLRLIMSIYDHLLNKDVSEVEAALQDANLQDWIWHGNGFINTDKIVSRPTPVDFKPHLYSLPMEVQKFGPMFKKLGVQSECSAGTLVSVLRDIQMFHKSSEHEDAAVARDLHLAVTILNILKGQLNELDESMHQKIVLPVKGREADLQLIPIEECTYCDTEWLQQGFRSREFEGTEGITLVHPNVPLSTAEALNVPTLMSRMVIAEELEMSVTGFGQYETLTNRIKSLLEDYPDGSSIAKELVQNADDAGATVVKFLYDERSNFDKMTSLLDESMKECQGPALWAYNDAMFSHTDFKNIVKLGGATKEMEIDKIGKFGLGFNAVYNITDVPSFVSGNHLVIFDPQKTHLGRSVRDRSKPGVKLDMRKNRTLIKTLPDQFHPYQNIFGCEIDPDNPNEYKGTLFRLPLRTHHQAESSEISGKAYDKLEVIKLLSLFMKGFETLLLFTQHVSRVELHHLSSSGSEQVLLFSVKKQKVRTITPLSINPDIQLDIFKAVNDYLKVTNNPAQANDILETSAVVEVQTTATENSQSLLGTELQSVTIQWLLSFAFSMKLLSKNWADKFESGHCLYGAVSVPLKHLDNDLIPVELASLSMKGGVFCHLPLPIQTNLPVHINGSFAVQSNRRHMCEFTDGDKYSRKAEWNKFLRQNAVCPAYHLLLRDLANLNHSTKVEYIKLWPTLSSTDCNWKPLIEAFYHDNFQDLAMVHDGRRHVNLSQAAIFDKSLSSDSEINALAVEAYRQSGASHTVVTVPCEVMKTLRTLNCDGILAPQMYDEERFLKKIFFPNIEAFDAEIRIRVLLWIFGMKDEKLMNSIKGTIEATACIPAGPYGNVLKKPSDLIHFQSKAAKLYHEDECRFVHSKEFQKNEIIMALLKLGLITDFLSWENIIERARSIEQLLLANPDKAIRRAKLFLKYLDEKLEYEKSDANSLNIKNVSDSLREIKMLPIAVPSHGDPVTWRNTDLSKRPMVSASEAYLSSYAYLLSSVYPLADRTCMSPKVQEFLGLQGKLPKFDDVLTQFSSVLSLSQVCLDHKSNLPDICKRIYSFLNNECKKEPNGILSKKIHNEFAERASILLEGKFLQPSDLAFDDGYNAVPPFLHKLPSDYSDMKSFFEALGVRKQFEPHDFARHLQWLEGKHRGNPLKDEQLQQSLHLLSGLQYSMARMEVSASDIGTVFIPNTGAILMPSSELLHNDCPWSEQAASANFTHPGVAYSVCKALAVKNHRENILDTHDLGVPFGQSERLITSLKRIIDRFPLNQEIFKELIQNADDARASEIHFVLDLRTHGTKRIFADSWKLLQGPALCVYNNRPFTQRDLEGIQRLGEGSKGHDPCKTGQYGVGFCSVYHLTDVPTIMTTYHELGEKVLCAMDPHCCYVPGANKEIPGFQYRVSENLQNIFSDVFTGYLEDYFDHQEGTFFRFPLRTDEMAKKSAISKNTVSPFHMLDIMHMFQKEAWEVLLFSNHLESLKLSRIGTEGKLVTECAVSAYLNEEDRAKRRAFHEACLEVGEQLKSGAIAFEHVKQRQVEYTLQLQKNPTTYESWKIVQVLGFSNPDCVGQEVRAAFSEGKLALLPRGGIAYLIEKYVNGQESSTHTVGKVFCCLPMPSQTGLPVHINGHFAVSSENRQEVWSTHDTQPRYKKQWNQLLCEEVIAHAYVALLKSIRPESFQHGDGEAQVFRGSRTVIDRTLSAFLDIFPRFSYRTKPWDILIEAIYSVMVSTEAPIFPCIREVARQSRQLEGYTTTPGGCHSPLWWIEWFPILGKGKQQAFFVSTPEVTEPHGLKPLLSLPHVYDYKPTSVSGTNPGVKQGIKDVLSKCGFNILSVDSVMVENIKKAVVTVDCLSPNSVMSFFKNYGSGMSACDLGVSLPSKIQETHLRNQESLIGILEYCYPSEGPIYDLEGMPLCLTDDGVLQIFSSGRPVYVSEYSDRLFQKCGDIFLHSKLRVLFGNRFQNGENSLRKLTVSDLGPCLLRTVPQLHLCKEIVWRNFSSIACTAQWLRALWEFVYLELKAGEPYRTKERLTAELDVFKEWCLLPVKKAGQSFLYRVDRASEILDTKSIPFKFQHAMEKLQVPQLDCQALSQHAADLVLLLTATFDQPVLILSAVHKACTVIEGVQLLLQFEMQKLLQYFSESTQAFHTSDEHDAVVAQLRALPFYETICGHKISLTNCAVYILPEGVLTVEIESWQKKSGIVFLKNDERLEPLFKLLQCEFLSVTDVYCEFILPHFQMFTEHGRMSHLKHLDDTYLSNQSKLSKQEKMRVLQSLKDLSTIKDSDGQLQPASYFYDPDIPLFRLMKDDRLPPSPREFVRDKWLTFLRKLGLNSTVTPKMCVEFASQIAAEAKNSQRLGTRLKSRTLAEHLLSLETSHRDDILGEVHSIRFIEPQVVSKALSSIYPQYGDIDDGQTNLPYICFRGSCSSIYTDIIWTCVGIRPEWADPHPYNNDKQLFQLLEITEIPTLDMVAHNFKTICSAMNESKDFDREAFELCCKNTYEFFQQHGLENGKLTSLLQEDLVNERCIAVGDREIFAKPNQTALNILEQDEIRPYLCKIPYEYGKYKSLFVALGVSEKPTFDQYARALNTMYIKTKGKRLIPNELKIASKALKGLFRSMQDVTEEDETNRALCKRLNNLHLLRNNSCLYTSSELIFNDAPWLYNRVKSYNLPFLVSLKECGLRENPKELLKLLPSEHRPQMLSCSIKEKLMDETKTGPSTEVAAALQTRLRAEAFCHAVKRLAHHQAHRTCQELNSEVLQSALDNLANTHIYAAKQISTHLMYKDKHVKGSNMEKRCFVEMVLNPHQFPIFNFYVKSDVQMCPEMLVLLADALNSVMGGILKESLVFLPSILVCDEAEIESSLDSLGVHSDFSQEVIQQAILPELGSTVPEDLHDHLTDAQAFQLAVGDFVAVENGVDAYVYGIVSEIISQDHCSVRLGEDNDGEWLIKSLKTFIRKD